MIDAATETSVRRSVTVEAPQQHAFDVFTDGFSTWWPIDSHHIGEVDAAAGIMEPREGGRWYERGVDGSECDWGRVLTWDPPNRIVLAWQLNADWKYDSGFMTEVEVRFIPEGDGRTRVELEHRGLERFGERAGEVRTAISSDGGWNGLLGRFAAAAAA